MLNSFSILFDKTISRECRFDCFKRTFSSDGLILVFFLYVFVFGVFIGPESLLGIPFDATGISFFCVVSLVAFAFFLIAFVNNLRWSTFKHSIAKEIALNVASLNNHFQIESDLIYFKHKKNCCHVYIPVSKKDVLLYSFNSDYSYSVSFISMAEFKKQAFLNPDSKKVEFIRQCESSTKLVDSMNLS